MSFLAVEEKKKLIYLEIIRIIAIFLVIFNHTGAKGFFLFSTYPFGSIQYFICMAFSVFCKIAVPLFLMVSGALLLNRDIPQKKIFKEKILKMFLVLLIFSAIYYIRLHILKYSDKFTIGDFFVRLYKGDIIIPYWYIYAYISFLLAFPFLRAMVKNLPEYAYKYLILLSIIFISVLPCIEYRFSAGEVTLNQYGKVAWLFTNIVIFPIIGYYLENVVDFEKINKKHILFTILFAIFGIGISCYMTYFKHRITGICTEVETQDFLDVFCLPICISVYLTIKYFCTKFEIPNLLRKVILSFGSCSFGIYLIHMAIIESNFINNLLTTLTESYKLNQMLSILLLCVLNMLISYIITFVLKKIPGLKKIL